MAAKNGSSSSSHPLISPRCSGAGSTAAGMSWAMGLPPRVIRIVSPSSATRPTRSENCSLASATLSLVTISLVPSRPSSYSVSPDRLHHRQRRLQGPMPLLAGHPRRGLAPAGGEKGLQLALERLGALDGQVVRQDAALLPVPFQAIPLDLLRLVIQRIVTVRQEDPQPARPLR